jgi:hypothetical protein
MVQHKEHSYVLPLELVHAAREVAADLRKRTEYVESGFLLYREIDLLHFEDGGGPVQLKASELLELLSLTRRATHDAAGRRFNPPPNELLLDTARNHILRFASLYFDELRALICKGKKGSLSAPTTAVTATIAGWLTSHIGVDSHAAVGVAVAVLIALLTATKGAFCRMTEPEAKASLAPVGKARPKKR